MDTPRVYKFDCSFWYWNACKTEFDITKGTVIPKKTIVNKDKDGKIVAWNISSSTSKDVLYIVAEDSTKDDEKVLCICYGQVKKEEIVLPTGVEWKKEVNGCYNTRYVWGDNGFYMSDSLLDGVVTDNLGRMHVW